MWNSRPVGYPSTASLRTDFAHHPYIHSSIHSFVIFVRPDDVVVVVVRNRHVVPITRTWVTAQPQLGAQLRNHLRQWWELRRHRQLRHPAGITPHHIPWRSDQPHPPLRPIRLPPQRLRDHLLQGHAPR